MGNGQSSDSDAELQPAPTEREEAAVAVRVLNRYQVSGRMHIHAEYDHNSGKHYCA
jgi:hypothetical protein